MFHWLLVVLMVFVPEALSADARVTELLQKVASAYSQVQTYRIEIRSRTSGHSISGDSSFTDQRGGPPLNSIMMARSGNSFYFEIEYPGSAWGKVVHVTDGRTEWASSSRLRQYTESPAQEWPKITGPGMDLAGLEWKWFAKFRAIAGAAEKARFVTDDIPPHDHCPGPTALVEITFEEPGIRAKERLWIDSRTNLVCRQLVNRIDSGRGTIWDSEETTSWTYHQIYGSIDPSLFAFVPPKGGRRVKKMLTPLSPTAPSR